ncbi:MAG: anhydro-N-acetylmuramic acid kinase [Nitrococcus mobilis]|nr:anhydro-N-acetylmuramic acid kinase [Nitrococcus mobilis]
MSNLYIGLISGTSMDAIDAALVTFDLPQQPRVLAACSPPLPPPLNTLLRGIGPQTPLASIARADAAVADAFADATLELLAASGYRREQIRAIGSHGQTVWHAADGHPSLSVQIGDPNRLAEKTGITVVADFRRRDMAAGGQGAPLAAGLHAEIFRRRGTDTIVLNLGGIANITLLPGDPEAAITGFDCGPANTLLDTWCRRHCNSNFDTDGAWAAGGIVHNALLEALASDEFFQRSAPKSTGPEYFNLAWLTSRANHIFVGMKPRDVQATLAELTAVSVARAIRENLPGPAEILVCGGGAHNRHLQARLSANLPEYRIRSTAEFGVDPDFVEAIAFAWLARCRIYERAGNISSVTGARREVVLGGVYAGNP